MSLSRAIVANFVAAAALLFSGLGMAVAGDAEKPYSEHVKCEGSDCKIDKHLNKGIRAFAQCQVCHGLDGTGSTIAPSLVEKLQEIDKERFMDVVINGYTGEIGVMPPWKENPNVMKHIEALYAYLQARSDGVLPAGKLKRFDR